MELYMIKKIKFIALAVIHLLLVLLIPLNALAAGDGNITVYVTITDNGGFFTGQNSQEPIIAYPVSVPRNSTVDDVLKALHAAECSKGADGYASASFDMYGTATWFISAWFGQAVDMKDGSNYNVAAYLNHNSNSTLKSRVKNGDCVDVLIYTVVSSANYSYKYMGLNYFNCYSAEAGVNESFTLTVSNNSMNMSTYAWETHPSANLPLTINGKASDYVTDDSGSVSLSFETPGTYYLMTGGSDVYAAAAVKVTVKDGAKFKTFTPAGPGRLAASGLDEDGSGDGSEMTVYVTVTDNGGYFKGQVSEENIIAYPVKVEGGATVDDVLDALHKLECTSGSKGYSSSKFEFSGTVMYSVTSFFGKAIIMRDGSDYSVSAWLNQDASSTLESPVKDGDSVTVCIYSVVSASKYSFKNWGLSYFDYVQAEAAVGETITLHAYNSVMNYTTYTWSAQPCKDLKVYINGELSDYTIGSDGLLTLKFDSAGTYYIIASGNEAYGSPAVKITVSDTASFGSSNAVVDNQELYAATLSASGLDAEGKGDGPDITVYVNVTNNGSYVMGEVSGEYLIAYPITVPGGATVDDVLQALNETESKAGGFGYSSYKYNMYGMEIYAIGNWFGKTASSTDGSNYALAAWLNRDPNTSLNSKVNEGDCIDVIIYSIISSQSQNYRNWGIGYFDCYNAKAGIGEEITLHAYNTVMNLTDYTWASYASSDLNVYINGEFSDSRVGSDGTLTLKFDEPGTYYILANGNSAYAAAPAKIVVEEGASFAESSAASAVRAPVSLVKTGADGKPAKSLFKAIILSAIALIVIASVITAIRSSRYKKD
jgi:hypothetical protein